MDKIVSFEKELKFHTLVSEITSISLDNDLIVEDNQITGNFIITGSYKISPDSTLEESINEVIPCTIGIDKKYNTKKSSIAIDDFRYKVGNDSLLINIDVLVKDLEVIEIIDSSIEEDIISSVEDERTEKEEVKAEEIIKIPIEAEVYDYKDNIGINKNKLEISKELINNDSKEEAPISSIFSSLANSQETFVKYHVYIIRDNDTLESIMSKYKTNREILSEYNDLDNVVNGTKLVIPNINE